MTSKYKLCNTTQSNTEDKKKKRWVKYHNLTVKNESQYCILQSADKTVFTEQINAFLAE